MLIDRKEFLSMLDDVRPGLASNEQDSVFTFSKKAVETFNGEIAVSRENNIKGLDIDGNVMASGLYEAVSKLKVEKIDITKKDAEIILSAGRVRAGIPLVEDAYVHDLKTDKLKWSNIPDGFLDAIERCSISCQPDGSGRPAESCVFVDFVDGAAMSCDGFRATRQEFDASDKGNFLLPVGHVKTVLEFNPVSINSEDKSWVHFDNKKAVLSVRKYSSENSRHAEIAKLFSVEAIGQVEMPQTLPDAVQRLAIFAKEEIKGEDHIDILVSDGVMRFSSRGIRGWMEEEVDIEYKGEEISFSISAQYLADITELEDRNCEVAEDRMLFSGDNWKHIVCRYVV